MKFLVQNVVSEKATNILIEWFYNFYERLNGKEAVRALNILKPHFSMDEKERNIFDSLDDNLTLAVESVKEINDNSNIMLIYICDDFGNLLGVSRFIYKLHSLVTPEIIVLDETKGFTAYDIYFKTVQFYEKKAHLFGFDRVNLEVPVFDIDYFHVAEQLFYEVVEPITNNLCDEKTVLFEKELNRNRSDDFGRTLTNK